MEFRIIRKSDLEVGVWSGGTTTQLAIDPPNSLYKNLDFNWRISSAVIEIDESTFTSLPGVDRWIMSLNGDLILKHGCNESIKLEPFTASYFKGEWETKSYGRVTDFNLMTRGVFTGELDSKLLSPYSEVEVEYNHLNYKNSITVGIYNVGKALEYSNKSINGVINNEELLLINIEKKVLDKLILKNNTEDEFNIVVIYIYEK